MIKNFYNLLFSLIVIFSFNVHASSNNEETQKYLDIFSNGEWSEQLKACNELQWIGFTDTQVFDVIESDLIAGHINARSKEALDKMSWYSKVLGISGNEKYRATLEQVAQSNAHKKVKKYANEGLDNINKYKKWNPIIRDQSNINPEKSALINGFSNMIRSDDWELKRIAAKRIFFDKITDAYLLRIVEEDIKKHYKDNISGRVEIDSLAWLTKAVASSGNLNYEAIVTEVANNASNRKVKNYAKKYLRTYY